MDESVRDFLTPLPVTVSVNALVFEAEVLMHEYMMGPFEIADGRQEGFGKV